MEAHRRQIGARKRNMWRPATSPPVTNSSNAPPCHGVPISARRSPHMGDFEDSAGHGYGAHVRHVSFAKTCLRAPPGLPPPAPAEQRMEDWLAVHAVDQHVRQGAHTPSCFAAPQGMRKTLQEEERAGRWRAGLRFGKFVGQGSHAESCFPAPPGLRKAAKHGPRSANWMDGYAGTGVRRGAHAKSYLAAPPGLHQAAEAHERMESWMAGQLFGQGVRQSFYAESRFPAAQGLRHAAEEDERSENWSSHSGSVPPPPPADSSMLVTTLLIHNVNRRLSQEDLLQILPCDLNNYDMFYLLFDLSKKRSSGRIFINFTTQEHAAAFQAEWHGNRDVVLSGTDVHGGRKPILVEAARRQGLEVNVAHWQRRLRQDAPVSCFPALFIGGDRLYFWEYKCSLLLL